MKIEYVPKNFRAKSLELIRESNEIIEDYAAAGYDLTLRQLYYQMVSRNLIKNSERSYKNFGGLISDARLAGLIDWRRIVDRTRVKNALPHWGSPSEVIYSAYHSYNIDYWNGQHYKPVVWIEKDALAGVIANTCDSFDVPFMACKGYMSQSAMWRYSQTAKNQVYRRLQPVLIYLGDHDPSGMHISSEDIPNRVTIFGADIEIRRIALNMDQVEEKQPPPNPAKLSDSRAADYINEYGYNSWELDALKPDYINELITREVNSLIDWEIWDKVQAELSHHKATLKAISDNYKEIENHLEKMGHI